MEKIHEKMAAIMAEVGAIEKGKTNNQQGFKYRGVEDVYAAVHGLMIKHGVYCLPECEQLNQRVETVQTSKGPRSMDWASVIMRYQFVCAEDGSFVSFSMPGAGCDYADKATGKAVSYADKYAIIQAFKIPTDDLLDSDTESPGNEKESPVGDLRKQALDWIEKNIEAGQKKDYMLKSINQPGVNKGYLEMIIEGRVK